MSIYPIFVTFSHVFRITLQKPNKNQWFRYFLNMFRMKKLLSMVLLVLLGLPNWTFAKGETTDGKIPFEQITQGEMITVIGGANDPNAFSHEEIGQTAALPLKHTSVESEISGFVARTYVTQEFQNPYKSPIEATYNFPLPHDASVDSMEMQIGDKKIIGKIDTRKSAEQKYEEAKRNGQTAALLNQERPNIFTQKVANIMPGDVIKIKISYFEVVKYDHGEYGYVFPMVVGSRYNPASVTDAGNITSPSIPAGYREGHTIDMKLHIVAGVNIKGLKSNSHDVNVRKISDSEAEITLKDTDKIPNKDFSFVYSVASDVPQIGFLTHKIAGEKDGYFALVAEPQKSPKKSEIRNREIVFVLDTSGSMTGRPIETVKKAMKKAISNLGPNDSFNVYNFNTQVYTLFPAAKNADESTKNEGLKFVESLVAGGGTMMLQPFQSALKDDGRQSDRMRIILGMTDGDVGNESEILSTIKSDLGANRLFMLGVDAAANRYLIDKMAESGNGKATYVLGEDDIDAKVDEFYGNFASPVLTDIKIDWDGLNVSDILPQKFADLYAGQPLYVYGKYSAGMLLDSLDRERNIKITGKRGNEDYSQTVKVNFKNDETANSSIATYWARQKINEIYKGNRFVPNGKLEEEVTALGLRFSIMSEFTSFVAVDDTVRNVTGKVETRQVPVYEVEGKDYRGTYGAADSVSGQKMSAPSVNGNQTANSPWSGIFGSRSPKLTSETLRGSNTTSNVTETEKSDRMAFMEYQTGDGCQIGGTGCNHTSNIPFYAIWFGIIGSVFVALFAAVRFFRRSRKSNP